MKSIKKISDKLSKCMWSTKRRIIWDWQLLHLNFVKIRRISIAKKIDKQLMPLVSFKVSRLTAFTLFTSKSRVKLWKSAFLMELDLPLLKIYPLSKTLKAILKLERRFKSFPKKENSIFILQNNSVIKISDFAESSTSKEIL